MTSLTLTLAERNRQTAATNLVVRHLVDRSAKHIHARQVDGKLAWLVESQTKPGKYYTVTLAADWGVDSCDCEDCAYRRRECKHIKAARALAAPVTPPAPTPEPVAEFKPAGGWLSERKTRRDEWSEEV